MTKKIKIEIKVGEGIIAGPRGGTIRYYLDQGALHLVDPDPDWVETDELEVFRVFSENPENFGV